MYITRDWKCNLVFWLDQWVGKTWIFYFPLMDSDEHKFWSIFNKAIFYYFDLWTVNNPN